MKSSRTRTQTGASVSTSFSSSSSSSSCPSPSPRSWPQTKRQRRVRRSRSAASDPGTARTARSPTQAPALSWPVPPPTPSPPPPPSPAQGCQPGGRRGCFHRWPRQRDRGAGRSPVGGRFCSCGTTYATWTTSSSTALAVFSLLGAEWWVASARAMATLIRAYRKYARRRRSLRRLAAPVPAWSTSGMSPTEAIIRENATLGKGNSLRQFGWKWRWRWR